MLNLAKTILLFIALSCLTQNSFAAEELLKGLKYWQVTTDAQQTIHLLQIDPQQFSIAAAHAEGKVIGVDNVATIAKRHNAIAAINGGFFKRGISNDGIPAGILKIQNQWYSVAYLQRGAIGWSKESDGPLLDRLQTKTNLLINQKQQLVQAVNQPGSANKIILYTDAYGGTAGSISGNKDYVIQNNRIVAIYTVGNTPIPREGYVYSVGSKAKNADSTIAVGNTAIVNIEVIPQLLRQNQNQWQKAENIVGGSPLLIYNGRIVKEYGRERLPKIFINTRHARSAVGILKNGHWLFAVVESKALVDSGMTIPEWAVFLHKSGCQHALNLDGGSSSTLYINDAVVNHSNDSDNNEYDGDYGWSALRQVSDVILVLKK